MYDWIPCPDFRNTIGIISLSFLRHMCPFLPFNLFPSLFFSISPHCFIFSFMMLQCRVHFRAQRGPECPWYLRASHIIPCFSRFWKEDRKRERAYGTHQSFKLLRIVHRLGVRDGGVTKWSAWWTGFISLEQWRWIQVKYWKELTINCLVIIDISASKDIWGTRKVHNREFWSNLNGKKYFLDIEHLSWYKMSKCTLAKGKAALKTETKACIKALIQE